MSGPPTEADGEREEGCSCWYEVLDAWHEDLPAGLEYLEIDFWSWKICPNQECKYFVSYYSNAPGIINSFGQPEYCNSYWNGFPPSTPISFNCVIPTYSNFDVNLQALTFDWPPTQGEDLAACIKFRIGCWEDCGLYARAEYSDPIILCFNAVSFPFRKQTFLNKNLNAATRKIVLSGCGCTPHDGGLEE